MPEGSGGVSAAGLGAAVECSGLEDSRFHDLRYTAATWLKACGFDLLTIGTILGHKSTQTTKRYAHLLEDQIIEVGRVGWSGS